MTEQVDFEPEWANPPGATISRCLGKAKIPFRDFAWEMGLDDTAAEGLLEGRVAIDGAIAKRLETLFRVSADFWLLREAQFRNDTTKLAQNVPVDGGRAWLRELPMKEMVSLGWIEPRQSQVDQIAECLRFFDVTSLEHYDRRVDRLAAQTKFRTSEAFKSKPHPLNAWLRHGEICARAMSCENWSARKLERLLPDMRKLTWQRDPQRFLPTLTKMCASAGVALVTAKAPAGCRASGATMFYSDKKAILLLSFRHLSDDHFWFSFFHECGHLILHPKDTLFVEGEPHENKQFEAEANDFAENTLLPSPWKQLLGQIPLNRNEIVRFSVRAGVSPGIVLGQLQHKGLLGHNFLNFLKRRYRWTD